MQKLEKLDLNVRARFPFFKTTPGISFWATENEEKIFVKNYCNQFGILFVKTKLCYWSMSRIKCGEGGGGT